MGRRQEGGWTGGRGGFDLKDLLSGNDDVLRVCTCAHAYEYTVRAQMGQVMCVSAYVHICACACV